MDYLKIDDNKAFFNRRENDKDYWHPIDEINKEDLFKLLNLAVESDFKMDEYDEKLLQNKAHQIIYKHLHAKFAEILLNKNKFKDDSENLFKEAWEKYRQTENVNGSSETPGQAV